MNSSNSTPNTFAALIGRVAIDTFNIAKVGELLVDELYGLVLLQKLNRAGLRIVVVTDDNILDDELTVELPAPIVDLPLAVRVTQAMDDTTLELEELERAQSLPCFLRKQAG